MASLRDLHIVEISSCVHTGKVNKIATIDGEITKGANGWYTPRISTGGVAYLFNKIMDFGKKGDMIFVADRAPLVKRAIYPEYKTHRLDQPQVTIQKEISEKILADCGYMVVYEEGYEADDVAYTLAEKYASDYRNVYLHTDDSDMYIIVRDNVHCLPVRTGGKIVTRANYEYAVRKDMTTEYNSLTFLKMVYGATKDNVPALPKNIQNKLLGMFWNETHFPHMRNRDFVKALIGSVAPEALDQFEIAYPMFVDSVSLGMVPDADWQKLKVWAQVVGNRKFGKPSAIPKDVKNKIISFFEECNYADEVED